MIFERLRFLKRLFEISKIQEFKILEEMGLSEVVRMTWFCHTPILGLPCGHCNPCKDAINEGFSWRVPIKGRILGFLRGCRNVAIRVLRKLK